MALHFLRQNIGESHALNVDEIDTFSTTPRSIAPQIVE